MHLSAAYVCLRYHILLILLLCCHRGALPVSPNFLSGLVEEESNSQSHHLGPLVRFKTLQFGLIRGGLRCIHEFQKSDFSRTKEGVFQGLIPILNSYLENMEVDVDTRCTILNYLKLIKKRASGELMTMARWMREFVSKHPEYKQDSVITDKMNFDLFKKCDRIAKGEEQCPELFGNPVNRVK